MLDVDTRDYLTANLRESSRIAFSLRSGALLRLIAYAESHPLLKNAIGKTRVRVFLLFHYSSIKQKRDVNEEKNRHAGFSTSIFPDDVRFYVGEAQMGKAHLRRHANLRFARISRSRARRRKKNAIREDWRRFAVGFFRYQKITRTRNRITSQK
ncbi:MAG: hypothetical protein M0P20_03110 [Methanocorpusculum sp.]|nr:hypothetical protein [Methanocorpusculum sp.]